MEHKQTKIEDIIIAKAIVQEAIINVLERKGMVMRKEIMAEVETIKKILAEQ